MYEDNSIEITMQKEPETKPLAEQYNGDLSAGKREVTEGKGLNQSPTSNDPFSPRGPGQPSREKKFADLMLSPVRYTQRKFRAGGT